MVAVSCTRKCCYNRDSCYCQCSSIEIDDDGNCTDYIPDDIEDGNN